MRRSTDPSTPRGGARAKERPLTAEDRRVWQAAMRDVSEIERRRAAPVPAAPVPAAPVPAEPVPALPMPALPMPAGPVSALPASRPAAAAMAPAPGHHYPHPPNPGIDRATLSRLRRGAIPIERTLDLHGLTESAAHGAVQRMVKAAWSDGVRLVLIITGKGGIGGEEGVLRRALPRWLATGALASHVLRLEPAQGRHGGGGAFYLLLRRRRAETKA